MEIILQINTRNTLLTRIKVIFQMLEKLQESLINSSRANLDDVIFMSFYTTLDNFDMAYITTSNDTKDQIMRRT